jgi:dTDP-4-amino-4,6-dideoxygalactose transaminase
VRSVPFCDLGAQHKEIKKEIDRAIKRVIGKSDFILGEDLALFEKEFASFCDTRYAVGVSSGTAALFLALLSAGVGPGDEVIVPAFTYIATALAVSYTGARPVFADIEEKTYTIDAAKIIKALTANTKAIVPVHLYGQPAAMRQILNIAKEYRLKVIEDAAQAHGASIKMADGSYKTAGGIGAIGAFSFYPSKNLGALGDGGMVTTNSEEVFKKLCMLRDYGRISKYEHVLIGYNSRLDTLQAAILREKLKKIRRWNAMRQSSAGLYNKLFKNVEGVITPYAAEGAKHVYHVYAIRVKRRDELVNCLKKKGIGAVVHYPIPLHLQKAYENLQYKTGDFPVSERVAREIISLPMYPHITKNQIGFVVDTVKKFLGE